ncbi:MAG: glycosyltransferase [Alphaproteobacteria bacterium]|nr:glycosyltransferase [Alphaproteobacteria bacterium]
MLSLVLPCYNEAGNIPLIFARLKEVLKDRDDIEVVLVDNGSTDDTAARIGEQMGQPGARTVALCRVPRNIGYGYGIMQGLRMARGAFLAWSHADMQTDPEDVLRALDACRAREEKKIFIKGKRRNRRLLESFFTFGMQVVASLALGVGFDDVNAQPKLFPRTFFEQYLDDAAPDDFSLDLFAIYQAKKNGYAVVEVPVTFGIRRHGEAKGGGGWRTRIRLIRRTLAYIMTLRAKVRNGPA